MWRVNAVFSVERAVPTLLHQRNSNFTGHPGLAGLNIAQSEKYLHGFTETDECAASDSSGFEWSEMHLPCLSPTGTDRRHSLVPCGGCDEEDKEVDKLGEEEDEELQLKELQRYDEGGQNTKGGSAILISGVLPLETLSPPLHPTSRPCVSGGGSPAMDECWQDKLKKMSSKKQKL